MKKIICLIVIALMVASVALTAEKITAKDLAGLKGTWVGSLDFGMGGGRGDSTACTLEILNDTVPVQAKLMLWDVPRFVAEKSGVIEGRNEFNLDDWQLTSQGTISWPSPEKDNDMFKVSMGSEKKLNATYSFRTVSGSAILKKK